MRSWRLGGTNEGSASSGTPLSDGYGRDRREMPGGYQESSVWVEHPVEGFVPGRILEAVQTNQTGQSGPIGQNGQVGQTAQSGQKPGVGSVDGGGDGVPGRPSEERSRSGYPSYTSANRLARKKGGPGGSGGDGRKEEFHVEAADGYRTVMARDRCAPIHRNSLYGVPNLLDLGEFSMAALLHNIRVRYKRGEYYSSIGLPILISVNPYKAVPHLYDEKTRLKYLHAADSLSDISYGGSESLSGSLLGSMVVSMAGSAVGSGPPSQSQSYNPEAGAEVEGGGTNGVNGVNGVSRATSGRSEIGRGSARSSRAGTPSASAADTPAAGASGTATKLTASRLRAAKAATMKAKRNIFFEQPHLFATAQMTYTSLMRNNTAQSIVISGESGAGKTEATKILLRYFSLLDKQGSNTSPEGTGNTSIANSNVSASGSALSSNKGRRSYSVEMHTLRSNPILEAFGNARTLRNDNSSRFGKFIQIFFDAQNPGRVKSARISHYLLEKCRLINVYTPERNFHIFYLLLLGARQCLFLGPSNLNHGPYDSAYDSAYDVGASSFHDTDPSPAYDIGLSNYEEGRASKFELRAQNVTGLEGFMEKSDIANLRKILQSFCLEDASEFETMLGSIEESVDGNEREQFVELVECLISIGFAPSEIFEIFSIVAALLHLHQLKFVGDEGQSGYTSGSPTAACVNAHKLDLIVRLLHLRSTPRGSPSRSKPVDKDDVPPSSAYPTLITATGAAGNAGAVPVGDSSAPAAVPLPVPEGPAAKAFLELLLFKSVYNPEKSGSWIRSGRDAQQATNLRDSIIKEIYSRLFSWLVKRINRSMSLDAQAQAAHHSNAHSSAQREGHQPLRSVFTAGAGTGGGAGTGLGTGGSRPPSRLAALQVALQGPQKYPHTHSHTLRQHLLTAPIGLLDIYGFEVFEGRNSFEQLCINFANEKLQQHFNHHVLSIEQRTYKSEGIEWDDVLFTDNREIIQALEDPPSGVFCVLDDTRITEKNRDAIFLQQLQVAAQAAAQPPGGGKTGSAGLNSGVTLTPTNGRQASDAVINSVINFPPPNKFKTTTFCVHHYAGDVEYDCKAFVDKNQDKLEHQSIFFLSDWASFSAGGAAVQNPSRALSGSSRATAGTAASSYNARAQGVKQKQVHVMSVLFPIEEFASQNDLIHRRNNLRATVSLEFRQQLDQLLTNLTATTPTYVRCIKPNSAKMPDYFDSMDALRQLNYAGLLESIRIRNSGFGVRCLFFDFLNDYAFLRPTDFQLWRRQKNTMSTNEIKAMCQRLLADLVSVTAAAGGGSTRAAGTTPTAIGTATATTPGGSKASGSGSASGLGWQLGRTRVFMKEEIQLQLETKRVAARTKYATVIQAAARGMMARLYRTKKLKAIIFLQTLLRVRLARRRCRRWAAARTIQRYWLYVRPWRRLFRCKKIAAIRFQRATRAFIARRAVLAGALAAAARAMERATAAEAARLAAAAEAAAEAAGLDSSGEPITPAAFTHTVSTQESLCLPVSQKTKKNADGRTSSEGSNFPSSNLKAGINDAAKHDSNAHGKRLSQSQTSQARYTVQGNPADPQLLPGHDLKERERPYSRQEMNSREMSAPRGQGMDATEETDEGDFERRRIRRSNPDSYSPGSAAFVNRHSNMPGMPGSLESRYESGVQGSGRSRAERADGRRRRAGLTDPSAMLGAPPGGSMEGSMLPGSAGVPSSAAAAAAAAAAASGGVGMGPAMGMGVGPSLSGSVGPEMAAMFREMRDQLRKMDRKCEAFREEARSARARVEAETAEFKRAHENFAAERAMREEEIEALLAAKDELEVKVWRISTEHSFLRRLADAYDRLTDDLSVFVEERARGPRCEFVKDVLAYVHICCGRSRDAILRCDMNLRSLQDDPDNLNFLNHVANDLPPPNVSDMPTAQSLIAPSATPGSLNGCIHSSLNSPYIRYASQTMLSSRDPPVPREYFTREYPTREAYSHLSHHPHTHSQQLSNAATYQMAGKHLGSAGLLQAGSNQAGPQHHLHHLSSSANSDGAAYDNYVKCHTSHRQASINGALRAEGSLTEGQVQSVQQVAGEPWAQTRGTSWNPSRGASTRENMYEQRSGERLRYVSSQQSQSQSQSQSQIQSQVQTQGLQRPMHDLQRPSAPFEYEVAYESAESDYPQMIKAQQGPGPLYSNSGDVQRPHERPQERIRDNASIYSHRSSARFLPSLNTSEQSPPKLRELESTDNVAYLDIARKPQPQYRQLPRGYAETTPPSQSMLAAEHNSQMQMIHNSAGLPSASPGSGPHSYSSHYQSSRERAAHERVAHERAVHERAASISTPTATRPSNMPMVPPLSHIRDAAGNLAFPGKGLPPTGRNGSASSRTSLPAHVFANTPQAKTWRPLARNIYPGQPASQHSPHPESPHQLAAGSSGGLRGSGGAPLLQQPSALDSQSTAKHGRVATESLRSGSSSRLERGSNVLLGGRADPFLQVDGRCIRKRVPSGRRSEYDSMVDDGRDEGPHT